MFFFFREIFVWILAKQKMFFRWQWEIIFPGRKTFSRIESPSPWFAFRKPLVVFAWNFFLIAYLILIKMVLPLSIFQTSQSIFTPGFFRLCFLFVFVVLCIWLMRKNVENVSLENIKKRVNHPYSHCLTSVRYISIIYICD